MATIRTLGHGTPAAAELVDLLTTSCSSTATWSSTSSTTFASPHPASEARLDDSVVVYDRGAQPELLG